MKWIQRVFVGLLALAVVSVGVVWLSYVTIPGGDTQQERFDAVVVLGYPALADGTPSREQRERALEGVREWKRGRAPVLIVTGGAAHNRWTEAEVEKRLAVAQGVPAEDVLVEGRSTNTIENAFYTWEIMKAHGWTSAEVVSSPSHLPRASLIFAHYKDLGLKWRMHAATWPADYPKTLIAAHFIYEGYGTALLRWFGFRKSQFLPGS
jgi:uncharacterized SAM-binding protein YcdF (DUF218 family)